MGGKSRLVKHILPLILADKGEYSSYVEPFVGGGSVITAVSGLERIGADLNPHTIGALELIRDRLEDIPQCGYETSEAEYKEMKLSDDIQLKGYYGFALSFGGMFFGSWRRDRTGDRDYVAESYRSAVKQHPGLQGVKLVYCPYDQVPIPPKSIIYCDPPYINTAGYKTGAFDHDAFYDWCFDRYLEGHKVFVSEFYMPHDFKCIWEKERYTSLSKNTGSKKAIERLYTLE